MDHADVGALGVEHDVVGLGLGGVRHLGRVDGMHDVRVGPASGRGRRLAQQRVDVPVQDLAVVATGCEHARSLGVPLDLVYRADVALESEQWGARVAHVEDDDGVAVLGHGDDDVWVERVGLEAHKCARALVHVGLVELRGRERVVGLARRGGVVIISIIIIISGIIISMISIIISIIISIMISIGIRIGIVVVIIGSVGV